MGNTKLRAGTLVSASPYVNRAFGFYFARIVVGGTSACVMDVLTLTHSIHN